MMSPVFSPDRETQPNVVGLTLVMMRDMLRDAVQALTRHGDRNLHYIDGLSILGEAQSHLLTDGVHPGPEGYKHMAKRYAQVVMPLLLNDTP